MPDLFKPWKQRQQEIFELLDYADGMITCESRLNSFKDANWAYSDDSPCNIQALANAGWFYYPKSACPNEAYCFVTLKCLGWEEDDDPWEEQKKRKRGHPLWRKFIPSGNDHEIIRKPQNEYTIDDLVLLSAAVLEGHIKYKVDSLETSVWEHGEALKDREHKKMATSCDFDRTMSDYEAKVKNWMSKVQIDITAEAKRLTDIKRTHSERFRNSDRMYDLKYVDKDQQELIQAYKGRTFVNLLEEVQNNENQTPEESSGKRGKQAQSRQSIILRKVDKAPPSAQKSKSYLY